MTITDARVRREFGIPNGVKRLMVISPLNQNTSKTYVNIYASEVILSSIPYHITSRFNNDSFRNHPNYMYERGDDVSELFAHLETVNAFDKIVVEVLVGNDFSHIYTYAALFQMNDDLSFLEDFEEEVYVYDNLDTNLVFFNEEETRFMVAVHMPLMVISLRER